MIKLRKRLGENIETAKPAELLITDVINSSDEEEEDNSGTLNRNIKPTEFMESMFQKLSHIDEDTGMIDKKFLVSDVYGEYVLEKEDDDGEVILTKFLSIMGTFTTAKGTVCNVSIIVVDDRRFYLSLARRHKDNKKPSGELDQFVNDIGNMRYILASMKSGMSQEQIDEEVDAINAF